ncbi:hypothetical protein CCAX7_15000 [Capsulimonas corticalis]|uniref:Uncharacterized protein n=1 Tax=Capsulimonas corticalis TaxID=2219043 RepID=A0A402CZA3_9BACT|nr:hypothetical protein [Capsulimonas corticalis]BDI29449.1 hypothetical protein CCAX7_15000 [Capsulimonas corticalis]
MLASDVINFKQEIEGILKLNGQALLGTDSIEKYNSLLAQTHADMPQAPTLPTEITANTILVAELLLRLNDLWLAVKPPDQYVSGQSRPQFPGNPLDPSRNPFGQR